MTVEISSRLWMMMCFSCHCRCDKKKLSEFPTHEAAMKIKFLNLRWLLTDLFNFLWNRRGKRWKKKMLTWLSLKLVWHVIIWFYFVFHQRSNDVKIQSFLHDVVNWVEKLWFRLRFLPSSFLANERRSNWHEANDENRIHCWAAKQVAWEMEIIVKWNIFRYQRNEMADAFKEIIWKSILNFSALMFPLATCLNYFFLIFCNVSLPLRSHHIGFLEYCKSNFNFIIAVDKARALNELKSDLMIVFRCYFKSWQRNKNRQGKKDIKAY